jgi:HTH-type transcriptional regulator/antitoxin HigA
MIAEMEKLLQKGFSNLTEQEEDDLEKVSLKVQQYEVVHFPMPVVHDIYTLIEAYMKENGLSRQKLAAFLGVGNSTLSEILNKKRPVTLDFAKKMHSKLNFDGNMILEMI